MRYLPGRKIARSLGTDATILHGKACVMRERRVDVDVDVDVDVHGRARVTCSTVVVVVGRMAEWWLW